MTLFFQSSALFPLAHIDKTDARHDDAIAKQSFSILNTCNFRIFIVFAPKLRRIELWLSLSLSFHKIEQSSAWEIKHKHFYVTL